MIAALAGAWCGCKPDGDAKGEEPTSAESTPAEKETPTPLRAEGQPLAVDLQLENLSPLYKGFFSHKPFVQAMASSLSPHVQSRSVTVKVVWTEEDQTGAIQALIPDGEETLRQVGAGLVADGVVDPAPLAPYVSALDTYRRDVGDRYDLRVLSFTLALELWDPHSESRCLWAIVGGDAETAVPGPRIECQDPFHKTHELQRDGDGWPAEIKGNRKARKILQGALGH